MIGQTTRRAALFGAVASVAAIGAASCAGQPALAGATGASTTAWDAAFDRYRASFEAAEVSGWDDDRLAAIQCDDWAALMHMPAPHIAALHWKLDYLYGKPNGNGTTTDWDYGLVSAVVEDARRLADAGVRA